GAAAPARARRPAHRADQGAGGVHRRRRGGPVQAGALPVLSRTARPGGPRAVPGRDTRCMTRGRAGAGAVRPFAVPVPLVALLAGLLVGLAGCTTAGGSPSVATVATEPGELAEPGPPGEPGDVLVAAGIADVRERPPLPAAVGATAVP